MKTSLLFLFFSALYMAEASAQSAFPGVTESNCILKNFQFESGESLPELRLHYATLGKPQKGADGLVKNAVVIMHGTTGSHLNFLIPRFGGALFGPGQLLDSTRYYLILPDAIGHGQSSSPSDGLHMKFPHYTYDDMVKADYLLIKDHLGVNHLRLVMGTSMGGMHTWVWAYTYPDFMDALMPLASLPAEIGGRNRMLRKMIIDGIETDPAWKEGEYAAQPKAGLGSAISIIIIMGSSPLQMQKAAPTRETAEALLASNEKNYLASMDANNVIYAFDASRFYNPAPHLGAIKAPLIAINSADDEVNPPELGIMEQGIKQVAKGRYILLPITDQTTGHGTHTNPGVWGNYLKELLERTERK